MKTPYRGAESLGNLAHALYLMNHEDMANTAKQGMKDIAARVAERDALKEALKEIISQIDQGGNNGKVFARDYCITSARALLAKLEATK